MWDQRPLSPDDTINGFQLQCISDPAKAEDIKRVVWSDCQTIPRLLCHLHYIRIREVRRWKHDPIVTFDADFRYHTSTSWSPEQVDLSRMGVGWCTTVQDPIRRMPPPSDVLPALFGALRDRLALHVSASGSATPSDNPPTALVASSQAASDVLLTSLSASDPSVQRCILHEIRHGASASKLQLLRTKRLAVRRAREAKQRQKQRLGAVAAAECDAALLDASTHDHKFQFFMTETHDKAAARLQTLFSECIAEMKKALVRMEGVAADTSEESESMVDEVVRRYEWQLFLARLQQDSGGDVDAALLVPGSPRDRSSISTNLSHSTNSKCSVKTVVQRALQEHGPAMENGDMLMVRSVISLRRTNRSCRGTEKSSRVAPSLHFGTSAAEMWTEVLEDMMSQASPTKPRRALPLSSSSTRRIRRLPPSRDTTALSLGSIFSTSGGTSSTFRQLPTEVTLQFPGTACDVPLSSVYIRWMLPAQSHSQDPPAANGVTTGNDWLQHVSVADYNIYFDIAEYEHNFAAIMQNYATSAALDEATTTFPIDHAVLASARRSLRGISSIFERTREQKEGHSADTIFAARQLQPCNYAPKIFDWPNQSQERSVFARASVLQLVQTLYYSKRFLTLMPGTDADILRKLYEVYIRRLMTSISPVNLLHDIFTSSYPSALFGEGCISTLYVPVVTGLEEAEAQDQAIVSPSMVSMHPLSAHAIHELLLIYVARASRTSDTVSNVDDSKERLTSLALSDAVNTLVPCRQTDPNQQVGARFCVIKNPRGLWKQNKETEDQDDAKAVQRFCDADIVFVEVSVLYLLD
ncbi:hypothetical protein PHYPSEUDO_008020 [Phytophthora pseudosyringae]|uniref:Uncharacterized protein n=1 Tax=Phytophthora pseudosyringae TaxID=221518 RepID=A0A8T1VIA5_9STRA|nr:hypothetical protein PHYPSEUDO_008020 [Phytophthora pseudosyringae]